MRNWINLINEYADPDDRGSETFYRGSASRAPKNLWERQGFKEWFHGSKVCDPSGNPLVAFHGSYEKFTEFKLQSEKRRSYGFNRLGFWFDIDPRTPEYFAGYTNPDELGQYSVGSVYPCVLSIKKPFHLDSEFIYMGDINDLRKAKDELDRFSQLYDHGNQPQYRKEYRDAERKYNEIRQKIIKYEHEEGHKFRHEGFYQLMSLLPNGAKSSDAEVDAFKNELISEGHDGIYIGDTAADFGSRDYAGTDWWIAFYPNQIKSIFAQSFSDSPDIMK